MDLCDGTLVDVLEAAQGTLPDKAVLKIFADVCTGVQAMHSQAPPIAHRCRCLRTICLPAAAHTQAVPRARGRSSPACMAAQQGQHSTASRQSMSLLRSF